MTTENTDQNNSGIEHLDSIFILMKDRWDKVMDDRVKSFDSYKNVRAYMTVGSTDGFSFKAKVLISWGPDKDIASIDSEEISTEKDIERQILKLAVTLDLLVIDQY